MSVKSRSKTFNPGDKWDDAIDWIHKETDDAVEFDKEGDSNLWFDKEIIIKKRLIITITYERDESTHSL